MKTKTLTFSVGALALLLLLAGVAGAVTNRQADAPAAPQTDVASGISYQGRLTNPGGTDLNGNFSMRFLVYDASVGGTALWDSGSMNITVDNGLFNVVLQVDQDHFDGQALWLSIIVDGETLSPRQEILPAAYAMSIRPGARIDSDAIGPTGALLTGLAPATGTAFYADAHGGAGIFGDSEDSYGVFGSSDNSWGGYFTSQQGHGLRVVSNGTDHYDYGAYITSAGGYAVYAQSATNQALRGEAGDISGITPPLGAVGVVGMGASRGAFGASNAGVGVYGTSQSSYGGYFYSNNYRGIYASSDSGDYAGYFLNRGASSSEPGIYVDGTIVASGSKAGYVVDVSLNEGPDLLEAGDVVAVVGVSEAVIGEIPVMRVVKATAENAAAVVGVVDQRFIVSDQSADNPAHPDAVSPSLVEGSAIKSGEYLSVVTLGAFKAIKVDTSAGGPIQPGDLLTVSPTAGYAMRAAEPILGTIIGKALEGLENGQGLIAVYVTMQ